MLNEKIIDLYRSIYLIRKVEDTIIENYFDDGMKTPMHMSKGAESISVGVCRALKDRGQFFGTYRSHGIYLSCGGDLNKFFSEMYGKENGRYRGKSGSMHLSSPENGYLSSSAIVASNIPVAVGSAFANKIKENGKIVAVFFGDGSMDEGNFWESINMACLWNLPVLFICEDNRFAVHTYKNKRQGYKDIMSIIKEFNIKTYSGNGTDAEFVYNTTEDAINHIDLFSQPCFLKFDYCRQLEHVGVNSDKKERYRLDDSFKEQEDDEKRLREKLISFGMDVDLMDRIIDKSILDALEQAKKSEFSDPKELYKDVLCD